MTVTLHVATRKERGKKLKKMRENGKIPAVVYGPKEKPQALTINQAELERLMREGAESTIITLKGLKSDTEVLMQDVAFDPVRGGVMHVDFYAIERGKELTTNVPLEYVGVAPAEKLGGVLTKVLHEVEVTCRPSRLPSSIEVDVSKLEELDAHITIADLLLPEGVKVSENPSDIVAIVQEVEEEKEEETETVDMESIEVEEKGKKEGDGEESKSEEVPEE